MRAQAILGDNIAYAKASAGAQDAEHLGENRRLVGGEVDHTVGDDHVDGRIGERDPFDLAFEELDVGGSGLGGVAPGKGEHLRGHVESVDVARRADPPGREQDVDPATGAEIEHRLALAKVGDGGGVAAAEAGQSGGIG